MTNEQLLNWLEDLVGAWKITTRNQRPWTEFDAEALAQLKAILAESTDEEQKELLEHLQEAWGKIYYYDKKYFPKSYDKIRALIMAPRPCPPVAMCGDRRDCQTCINKDSCFPKPSVTMAEIYSFFHDHPYPSDEQAAEWLRSPGVEVKEK